VPTKINAEDQVGITSNVADWSIQIYNNYKI